MTGQVAHGKALPPEVLEQVTAKTDGVPLFVEELTKMVLESGLLQEREERYELTGALPPLAIPATLHDSLMARLDRLAAVKAMAQLGATLGREFSYELLQAVAPWDEETLQQGLRQLVEAEFLYQRGVPPQVTYVFKHALIQDAAYQSLLRSTRQQYHQRIAQVLAARFPAVSDTQPELLAHRALGLSLFLMGELAQAREHFIQGAALYDPQQHRTLAFAYGQDPGVGALLYDAWALWILGYPDQALRRSHEACTLAEDLAHPHTLAYGFAQLAMFHQYRRDREEARRHAEAATRVSREQGFPFWLGVALILQGCACAIRHQAAAQIPSMHEGMAIYHDTDAALFLPYFLALLAEIYGAANQPDAGLRFLDEARTVMDSTQERFYEAEVHRVQGELVLAQTADQHALAETCFQHALDIAHRQQTKSWELRAATSLARLWQQQGKRAEARELLAPIYGWFTEGFDTADLQEAKALLEELGG
jgi:predicted ATPase